MARFHARALALCAFACVCGLASAAVSPAPALINFQGRLNGASGKPVPDGDYPVEISIWDAATGGAMLYVQSQMSTVKNGLFSAPLNIADPSFFGSTNLWVQVQTEASGPMTPRQQLTAVPFAYRSNTVPDASIGSVQLSSDAASLNKVSGGTMASSAGSIGIGTASPGRLLQVGGSPGQEGILRLSTSAATSGAGRAWDIGVPLSESSTSGKYYSFGITDTGAGTDPQFMVQWGSGNIGIGTTSPTERLSLNGKLAFTQAAGDEPNAGKIDYRGFDPNSMSLVGAGTASGVRNIRFYDTVSVGFSSPTNAVAAFNGNVGIGTASPAAMLDVNGTARVKVIQIMGGSDVAEPFNVRDVSRPGMVVCIDPDRTGALRLSGQPYDRTVAGIISGAGGIQPGMTLTQTGTAADGNHPVALSGRVWCYCDADANGPIAPGDLLTTSSTPGHAMKATDAARSQGAILGKAMSRLASGKGLVLVLVTLQ